MPSTRFVRVVERQGWDVELIDQGRTLNFPSREEAFAAARAEKPEWIELGEVVTATESVPQHHSWTTFRLTTGGEYERSHLSWGGRPRGHHPT